MRIFLAIITLSIASLILFWQPNSQISFWQDSHDETRAITQTTRLKSVAATAKDQQQTNKLETKDSVQNRDPIDEETFTPNPEVVASLRQARLKGDARTPNLAPNHEREAATEEELGDHEQYLEYERRQQKRVYRAYVEASKVKTAQLRSMIERGKSEGISDEEIAFAEEKVRGIEEMAAKLQQDYPDIMQDSYQPPADWLIENLGKEDDSNKSDESEANIEQ